jgi:hypothetical protein
MAVILNKYVNYSFRSFHKDKNQDRVRVRVRVRDEPTAATWLKKNRHRKNMGDGKTNAKYLIRYQ